VLLLFGEGTDLLETLQLYWREKVVDKFNCKIIDHLADLPIGERPYREIAARLGIARRATFR
jgi:O6-methylguanine-DNA--protein-cysteine methyltransferase